MYDLFFLIPLFFSGISYLIVPFIWVAKLELKNTFISKEDLIANIGILQNETNIILIILKDLDFQLGLLVLSGLIILISIVQARFHPRKIGLFLIIFSILRIDEFIRFQAQIQYSSHGTGSAFMFLRRATMYNLDINPTYIILQFCIHLSLVLAGLFLLFLPLSKFRKEITKLTNFEKNKKTTKEKFFSRVTSFFPFFGIFSTGLLGMLLAANLQILTLDWEASLFIIYLIFIILLIGFFMGFVFLLNKIIEPIYPQNKSRKIVEYTISSSFFILLSVFIIFFWADQFDTISLTLNYILENIFGKTGINPERKLVLSTLNYLFVFIIPLSLASLILYFLMKRKMKKEKKEKQDSDFLDLITKTKKSHIMTLFLLLIVFGLPSNLMLQGSNIFSGLTITNSSASDSFGLNWNSSNTIQILDLEIFSNSSFFVYINFIHNYHNIPLFLRQDFIFVNQIIVDSDYNGFFDSSWNFSYLEIDPGETTYEYLIRNDTRGYNFYLKNSGEYLLSGTFNESVVLGQNLKVFLSYKQYSEENEIIVLSNIMSTTIEF
ncbi:MAG: hypothetical protein H7641_08115 [Candidatus Heimdallarchaeota archaeon]|nr:hypothetical protein [Candidatus Heimdallarchaeota archaeon]MCK4877530.1 hypothetical protein [Candidatus Heimdallarchaeota archaeon]